MPKNNHNLTYHRSAHIKRLLQMADILQKDIPALLKDNLTHTAWNTRINLPDQKEFDIRWAKDLAKLCKIDYETIYNWPEKEHIETWKKAYDDLQKEKVELEYRLTKIAESQGMTLEEFIRHYENPD